MGVFIGLDVSLAKTAVCVVDRDGGVLWQGKVPSEPEPLVERLAEWSGVIDLNRGLSAVGMAAPGTSQGGHTGRVH
jgi:predicted NBD/HSP70 family sugar kinase